MRPANVGSEAWRRRYGPWALVVGGAYGLGAAWSEALGRAGLAVLVVDVDAAGLQDHLRTIDVNCRAAVEVAHTFAPSLGARGRGGSGAGPRDAPPLPVASDAPPRLG